MPDPLANSLQLCAPLALTFLIFRGFQLLVEKALIYARNGVKIPNLMSRLRFPTCPTIS